MTADDEPAKPGMPQPAARPLAGRTAVVTGAAQGIGRAVARRLVLAGATAVVTDIDGPLLAGLVAELGGYGPVIDVRGDLTDPAFPELLMDTAMDAGGIDIVINNAGYVDDDRVEQISDRRWEGVLDVNLNAPFRILRAFGQRLPALMQSDRSSRTAFRKIVNITSLSGVSGLQRQANYSAAKAGLIGLTKSLAKEWGNHGVNVNAVAFGLIQTRITAPTGSHRQLVHESGPVVKMGLPQGRFAQLESSIPLRRAGTPAEAAGAVYLLTLPESDYITGHVLHCDGGLGA